MNPLSTQGKYSNYLAILATAGLCAAMPCCRFDPSGVSLAATCGNGVMEPGEVCDGYDTGQNQCTDIGYPGGTLKCAADCGGFDISECEPGRCGDGIINGSEECDGANLDGQTCQTLGFASGSLTCGSLCRFDVTACIGGSNCGNNIIDGGEPCDGTNLNGQSCASLGEGGGTLACLPDCTGFDVSGCTGPVMCGDNIIEGGEVCDNQNLDGQTCQTRDFASGTLHCLGDCSGFDVSQCKAYDGDPCVDDEDCDGGICWEEAMGWPDGYCSRSCTPGNCPGDGVCVWFTDYLFYRCVDTCQTQSDCRSGYDCTWSSDLGTRVCWPP